VVDNYITNRLTSVT